MIEYRWSSARAVLLDEKGAIEVDRSWEYGRNDIRYEYDAVGKIAKVDCANLATQLGRPTVRCVIGVHH